MYLELYTSTGLNDFIKKARQLELMLGNIQVEPEITATCDRVCLVAMVGGNSRMKRKIRMNKILESNSVQYMEEL